MEEWRNVIGFEGLYLVSNFGRVQKINKTKENTIKVLQIDKHGYVRVQLWKNGKSKLKLLHRLVVEAFVSNENNLPYINHKDEDKTNNRGDNLEWCTGGYNNRFGTRGKRIAKNNIGKHGKQVIGISKDNTSVVKFNSIEEASIFIGRTKQAICENCKGRTKYCNGYKWFYYKEVVLYETK